MGLLSGCVSPLQTQSPQAGRQYYLPPEYEAMQGMIVSDQLMTFPNGTQLLSTLLSEGAEVWLLSADAGLLKQTRSVLSERFGLQAAQLDRLSPLPVSTDTVWARD